ncbi:hypothetical protein KIS1582_1428 [Cytobacillus firmus]|uniref:Uncharacterized protein n=1 Tax=Cytobacillus firmus TaxID=1399 RepID=A0A800MYL2_CYTFI|nr:hypothetical protein KIS1582_1428 [Cytobacillus firmus]
MCKSGFCRHKEHYVLQHIPNYPTIHSINALCIYLSNQK